MPILDFIMENLYIFLVAFFFLSSLLAKRHKEREEERKSAAQRSHGQPHVGSVDTNKYDVGVGQSRSAGSGGPSIASSMGTSVGRTTYGLNPEHSETYTQLQMSETRTDFRESRERNSQASKDTSGAQRRAVTWSKPNADDAIQGMIWAEVFGPPRAKKPFRGGSYRQ